MKSYIAPEMERVYYRAEDVLTSSKPVDDAQKNGLFNAEGSAAGWVIEDLV